MATQLHAVSATEFLQRGSTAPEMQDVRFANGATVRFSSDPDADRCTPPTDIFTKACASVASGLAQIEAVKQDKSLSLIGQAAKIETAGDDVLAMMIRSDRDLKKLDAAIAAAEADAYAAPKLEPTDAVGYLGDQERRAWLQSLQPGKRTKLLEAIQRGEEVDLMLAIVRSPVPLGDAETLVARDAWIKRCRDLKPHDAARIDAWQRSRAWGASALGHLQGVVTSALKPDAERLRRVTAKLGN